jgi:cytochrome c553
LKRFAAVALAASCACSLAADPPPGSAGREVSPAPAMAQMCATCHGPLGISVTPDAPHLAGQPRIYLEAQLKAFRSGQRRHEVMNVIAKPLGDADIADLSQWYASIPFTARGMP